MTPTFRPGDHDAPPAATMAPAPSRRARPTVLVLAGRLACPSLVQGAPRPQADDAAPPAPRADAARIPEPALGVWYPDDAQAQCGHYLQAPGPDDDVDADTIALVGALVVTPRLSTPTLEYGEGSSISSKRVEQVADATWRVEADVGIDVLPTFRPGRRRRAGGLQARFAVRRHDWSRWGPAPARTTRRPHYVRCGAVRAASTRWNKPCGDTRAWPGPAAARQARVARGRPPPGKQAAACAAALHLVGEVDRPGDQLVGRLAVETMSGPGAPLPRSRAGRTALATRIAIEVTTAPDDGEQHAEGLGPDLGADRASMPVPPSDSALNTPVSTARRCR